MMKKLLEALAFAVVLVGTTVVGCGGGASGGAGPQTGKPNAVSCDQLSIRSTDQFDDCRNKCRTDKQIREQSCANDTQCMMAAGNQTQQCFGKCEDGRNTARAGGCYKE